MDTDTKAKWVAALRSGEYEQTTAGELYDGKCYCCLGVLNEVAKRPQFYDIETTFNLPPQTVSRLIQMNDSQERTFREIADFIEENL